MEVSVIIPTYNRQTETDRAVNSVINQTLPPSKIIIVDDGSNPPYQAPSNSKIEVIYHTENRGAAQARNTGVEISNTKWIAFLDSDDIWRSDRLEQISDQINPEPLTIWSTGAIIHDDLRQNSYKTIPTEASRLDAFASGCWYNPGSCMILLRDTWNKVGPMKESLRRYEDFDWALRFARLGGKLRVIPHIGVEIHKSLRPTPETAAKAIGQIVQTIDTLPNSAKRKAKAYLLLERASADWYHGSGIRSICFLGLSFICCPRLRVQVPHD